MDCICNYPLPRRDRNNELYRLLYMLVHEYLDCIELGNEDANKYTYVRPNIISGVVSVLNNYQDVFSNMNIRRKIVSVAIKKLMLLKLRFSLNLFIGRSEA